MKDVSIPFGISRVTLAQTATREKARAKEIRASLQLLYDTYLGDLPSPPRGAALGRRREGRILKIESCRLIPIILGLVKYREFHFFRPIWLKEPEQKGFRSP